MSIVFQVFGQNRKHHNNNNNKIITMVKLVEKSKCLKHDYL